MKAWELQFTSTAQRNLKELSSADLNAVLKGIGRFAESNSGDIKKLKGVEPTVYRLRVGSWRIFFEKDQPALVLIILRVVDRKDAY